MGGLFSDSNLCIHRCPLTIPAFPLAQLCSVAWAEEYQHVAAIFKTPNDGMSYGRLLLALFNLSTEVLVCYIDIGGSDDPDLPTCDVAISLHGGLHVPLVALSWCLRSWPTSYH